MHLRHKELPVGRMNNKITEEEEIQTFKSKFDELE
jgi:hypothetical protein